MTDHPAEAPDLKTIRAEHTQALDFCVLRPGEQPCEPYCRQCGDHSWPNWPCPVELLGREIDAQAERLSRAEQQLEGLVALNEWNCRTAEQMVGPGRVAALLAVDAITERDQDRADAEAQRERAEYKEKRWRELAEMVLESYHINSARRPFHDKPASECTELLCTNYRKEIAALVALATPPEQGGVA